MFSLYPLHRSFLFILLFASSFAEAAAAVFFKKAYHSFPETHAYVPKANATASQETEQLSLAAPQQVTARASLVKAVAIRWQPVEGAENYEIEKSATGEEDDFSRLTTVPAGVHYFRESGLGTSETYYYRVKATASGTASDYSAIASATTNPDDIVRIMPMGDSNTEGGSGDPNHGVPESERIGYRKELYKQLVLDSRIEGYKIDFVGSEQMGQAYQEDFLSDNGFELDIDHAGFGGARDEDIAALLKYGEFSFYGSDTDYRGPGGGPYLDQFMPDIILLHIGTNWVSGSATAMDDVRDILDEVDKYEARENKEVTVIVAKIIKRVCYTSAEGTDNCPKPTEAENTIKYNNMLDEYVKERISAGDRLVLVDMQDGAGIDYRYSSDGGDMEDALHPNQNGYDKMAQVWFDALSSPAVPLPVELVSFNAALSKDKVYLEWVTASEKDNNRFEVERMQEGGSFSKIGTVVGAGDSKIRIVYTYQDQEVPGGLLYYRLKQVDQDGAYSYSKVVAVQSAKVAGPVASLYPNLTSGSETVHLHATGLSPASPVAVTVIDTKGKRVLQQSVKAGKHGNISTQIQMPDSLPKGLYIVQVSSSTMGHKLKLIVR